MCTDVTHFSRLAMISVHYWHCWSLPSLFCGCLEKKASDRHRLCSATLFLSPGRPELQPAFVRKQLLSRHSRRSLEVRSFIPCLMKRDVELWFQPAGSVGRGVAVCSVERASVESKPTTFYTLPGLKSQSASKPRPQRLACVRYGDCPAEKSLQGSRSRILFSFSVCTAVSRQACHICTLPPGRKRYIVYSFREQHCGESTTLDVCSSLLLRQEQVFLHWVVPPDPLSRSPCVRLMEVFWGWLTRGPFCSSEQTRIKATVAQGAGDLGLPEQAWDHLATLSVSPHAGQPGSSVPFTL